VDYDENATKVTRLANYLRIGLTSTEPSVLLMASRSLGMIHNKNNNKNTNNNNNNATTPYSITFMFVWWHMYHQDQDITSLILINDEKI
jgi:hypothetical protein